MTSLTVSVIFVFFGFILWIFPPKRINGIYGYRTPMSMKNQDTWNTAQKLGGYSLVIFGVSNGIFGAWSILQPMDINEEGSQLVFLLLGTLSMLIIDEVHLRKIFNKEGSRKSGT